MNVELEIYVIASGEVASTGAASSQPVGFPSVAEPLVEVLLHVTFASLLVLCLERVKIPQTECVQVVTVSERKPLMAFVCSERKWGKWGV